MASSAFSSSSSSKDAGPGSSKVTPDRIAKLTIASSLAGALLTAAYESTIGRARAVRKLEAQAQTSLSSINASVTGSTSSGGPMPTSTLRPDVAKYYRHNTMLLSAAAALNSGLVAFAFFSLREYAISPTLVAARSSGPDASHGIERPLTWSAMRTLHLEDTALTSALLGGAFNAWKKGIRGVFPGAFTASLACTALQLVANELDVQRIRYISSRQAHSSTPHPSSPNASPASTNTSTPTDAGPGLGWRMLALIGITKVDEEEYIRRLKAKRERHLTRIRELEALEAARLASDSNSKKADKSDLKSGDS